MTGTDGRGSAGASDGPLSGRAGSGLTRRGFLAGAGGLLLLGTAGCGGSEDAGSGGSQDTRTIEQKYGTTRIEGTPERVVSVGFTDQDPLLALGVVPAAMTRWIEDRAVWPWNEDDLGGGDPELLPSAELNYEQVAALGPDLIVGMSSSMTQEDYETLSGIAPTVFHTDEYLDFGVPWQVTTRTIGEALNRQDRAERVVSDLEARVEKVRGQHPEFRGTTVALVLPGEGGTFYPWGSQDPRARFMASLGFEIPQRIDELAGNRFYATVSEEQLGILDQDLLIWLIQTDEQERAIRESEVYRQLDVVRRGQDMFFRLSDEEPIVPAFSYGTVLSQPYLLDNLVPRLSETLNSTEGTTG